MFWLLESPWTIGLTGIAAAAICGYGWIQTGKRELLFTFFGIIAASATLLLVERWWVTDKEAIQATIREIARDVESNDFNKMVRHFHSAASEIREQARGEVGNYHFKSISVKSNFEIKLEPKHQPPKAIAGFNAVAVVTIHSLGDQEMTVARHVEFLMYKDSADGKWKIAGYGHRNAIPGQSSQFDKPLQDE
jgi:hypothetical protein